MNKCISCIKDKATGECYDIKDKTARAEIENLKNNSGTGSNTGGALKLYKHTITLQNTSRKLIIYATTNTHVSTEKTPETDNYWIKLPNNFIPAIHSVFILDDMSNLVSADLLIGETTVPNIIKGVMFIDPSYVINGDYAYETTHPINTMFLPYYKSDTVDNV